MAVTFNTFDIRRLPERSQYIGAATVPTVTTLYGEEIILPPDPNLGEQVEYYIRSTGRVITLTHTGSGQWDITGDFEMEETEAVNAEEGYGEEDIVDEEWEPEEAEDNNQGEGPEIGIRGPDLGIEARRQEGIGVNPFQAIRTTNIESRPFRYETKIDSHPQEQRREEELHERKFDFLEKYALMCLTKGQEVNIDVANDTFDLIADHMDPSSRDG